MLLTATLCDQGEPAGSGQPLAEAEIGSDVQNHKGNVTELVRAPAEALRSDPHDFAGLYLRHRSSFTLHARRYLKDPRDADEVVQEAFLRLFLALPELETELQALAYCRRTITNLCIDRYRADARRPQLVDLDSAPVDELAGDDPGDPVVRAEDAALVRDALAMLPALHRSALVKREIEEKPLAVIADELAIPEDNVKHVLFRARRGLRKLLAGTSLAPGVDAEGRRTGLARGRSGGVAALLLALALGLGSGPNLEAIPVVGRDLPDVLGVTRIVDTVGDVLSDAVDRVVPGERAADDSGDARRSGARDGAAPETEPGTGPGPSGATAPGTLPAGGALPGTTADGPGAPGGADLPVGSAVPPLDRAAPLIGEVGSPGSTVPGGRPVIGARGPRADSPPGVPTAALPVGTPGRGTAPVSRPEQVTRQPGAEVRTTRGSAGDRAAQERAARARDAAENAGKAERARREAERARQRAGSAPRQVAPAPERVAPAPRRLAPAPKEVAPAPRQAAEQARQAREAARTEAKQIKDAAKDDAKQAREAVKDQPKPVTEAARSESKQARETAKDEVNQVTEQAKVESRQLKDAAKPVKGGGKP